MDLIFRGFPFFDLTLVPTGASGVTYSLYPELELGFLIEEAVGGQTVFMSNAITGSINQVITVEV